MRQPSLSAEIFRTSRGASEKSLATSAAPTWFCVVKALFVSRLLHKTFLHYFARGGSRSADPTTRDSAVGTDAEIQRGMITHKCVACPE